MKKHKDDCIDEMCFRYGYHKVVDSVMQDGVFWVQKHNDWNTETVEMWLHDEEEWKKHRFSTDDTGEFDI